jgi:hypothetical protein
MPGGERGFDLSYMVEYQLRRASLGLIKIAVLKGLNRQWAGLVISVQK